jgi:hypothetical protein
MGFTLFHAAGSVSVACLGALRFGVPWAVVLAGITNEPTSTLAYCTVFVLLALAVTIAHVAILTGGALVLA